MSKRTASVDVDKDFSLDIDVCKAVERNGKRVLTGVASGVLEDADGERVSKNAIVKMARSAVEGLKLVAGSHSQDWHNEIGEVSKVWHDPETDELLIDCELAPEGTDPLADKAWNLQTTMGKKLGFSIGGKLKSAYFEVTDTGKKRKVLDDILLRHVALTQQPSYRQSFALAVAKIAGDEKPPADAAAYGIEAEDEPAGQIVVEKVIVEEVDAVAKADSTVASAPQDASGANAGTDDNKAALDVDNDGDNDADKSEDKKLPQGSGERHLACPNCGHEFAAEMPAEVDTPESIDGGDDTNDRDAHKRAPESEETDMALDKTLENLRQLAGVTGEAEVEKTEEKKDDAELTDVEKLVAASHEAQAEGLSALEEKVAKGFEGVGEVLKKVIERIDAQPAGRKSVARVGVGAPEGTPTRAEVEQDTVGKTTGSDPEDLQAEVEKIAAEGDPAKALALLNKSVYGVDSNIATRPTQSLGLDVAQ